MGIDPADEATLRPPDKHRRRERPPALLRVVHPPELTAVFELSDEPVDVGRSTQPAPGARVAQVMHPTVSRRHLSVRWEPKSWEHLATDKSAYGSWIDGVAAGGQELPLSDGSVVRIGEVTLVYESGYGLSVAEPEQVSGEAIPGEAVATRRLRAAVAQAADDPSPALLIGETGTGKEYIVRELHRLSGRGGPWLAVNCAELSEQLIESQLFGHERGAFTGAEQSAPGLFRSADKGTLFLDEIGELPLPLQPKLLRVLQEGEVLPVGGKSPVKVDVRVVAATNVDLPAQVQRGGFRRDLYARLALWEIEVPALRHRRADILGWIGRLHARWLTQRPQAPTSPLCFDADAVEAMLLHQWPNNLREVDRLVHDLASRGPTPPADGAARPRIDYCDIREHVPSPRVDPDAPVGGPAVLPAATATDSPGDATEPSGAKLPAPTREELERVMDAMEGSVRAVAKHFGRDRRQIYRWLKAHGLRE